MVRHGRVRFGRVGYGRVRFGRVGYGRVRCGEAILIRRKIIVDTREQEVRTPGGDGRWEFGDRREIIVRKLDEADYSLDGLEGICRIERKTLPDFVACCGSERERFERELVRLRETTRYPWVFIEASVDDVVRGAYPGAMTPASILSSPLSWSLQHEIFFVWCGNRLNAIDLALRLFDSVERRVKRLRPKVRSRPLPIEPAS